jgi:DNA polymerase III delta subunit
MPFVKHPDQNRWLAVPGTRMPALILVAGEEYLVQEAFDWVKAVLKTDNKGGFNLEILDGRSASMGDIVEQVTTFSFYGGKKIVAVKQAPLFSTRAGPGEVSYSDQDLARLSSLAQSGIPDGHFLVMTAGSLDRRRKIFKTLESIGLVIDCTVPLGARKVDLEAQQSVLQNIADKLLARSGKAMDAAAFSVLADRTGFNPGLFASNLEKLVVYAGERPAVCRDDVQTLIQRDKRDPIFSFTNALMEKNTGQALFYLSSLLKDGFHPLQILKSIENLARRLLLVKAFAADFFSRHPGMRKDRMPFNTFVQQVMPRIIAHDDQMKKELAEQHTVAAGGVLGGLKKQEKKSGSDTDLLLAPNPKNPYPVFQVFEKAALFSLDELCCAHMALGDLDFDMKSSSLASVAGIEHYVMIFCQKGGWHHAPENQDNRNHFQPELLHGVH